MGIENPIRRRRVEPNTPAPKYAPVPVPAKEPSTPAHEPEKTPV